MQETSNPLQPGLGIILLTINTRWLHKTFAAVLKLKAAHRNFPMNTSNEQKENWQVRT